MKLFYKFVIAILLFFVVSCASNKQIVVSNFGNNTHLDSIHRDEEQRKSEKTFVSDSANNLSCNIGWVAQLVANYKIKMNTMPYVFKRIDAERFSIELPCWENDNDESLVANVISEHHQLDSAMILAKQQGVDIIHNQLLYNYEECLNNAEFSCVCIVKEKKKYIVNATIRMSNPNVDR